MAVMYAVLSSDNALKNRQDILANLVNAAGVDKSYLHKAIASLVSTSVSWAAKAWLDDRGES